MATEHHRQRESIERGSIDPAHLFVGQVEGGRPRARGFAPEREAHGRDHQGNRLAVKRREGFAGMAISL